MNIMEIMRMAVIETMQRMTTMVAMTRKMLVTGMNLKLEQRQQIPRKAVVTSNLLNTRLQ